MKAEANVRNVDPLDERWITYEVEEPIVVDLPTVWSKDSVSYLHVKAGSCPLYV
jgi:hypothetical protein